MIREITGFCMQTHMNDSRKEVKKKFVNKVENITREPSYSFTDLS